MKPIQNHQIWKSNCGHIFKSGALFVPILYLISNLQTHLSLCVKFWCKQDLKRLIVQRWKQDWKKIKLQSAKQCQWLCSISAQILYLIMMNMKITSFQSCLLRLCLSVKNCRSTNLIKWMINHEINNCANAIDLNESLRHQGWNMTLWTLLLVIN